MRQELQDQPPFFCSLSVVRANKFMTCHSIYWDHSHESLPQFSNLLTPPKKTNNMSHRRSATLGTGTTLHFPILGSPHWVREQLANFQCSLVSTANSGPAPSLSAKRQHKAAMVAALERRLESIWFCV